MFSAHRESDETKHLGKAKHMRQKFKIPSIWMPLILAIIFVFCCNFVLLGKIWHALDHIRGLKTGFALTIPVFFIAIFHVVITLFSARQILKPLFVFLIILSSVLTYAMYNYGVVFDRNMIVNILETNTAEASSYINWPLFGWISVFGILPALLLIATPIAYPSMRHSLLLKFASIGISVAIIVLLAIFFFKDYASFIRNNPALRKDIVPTYAMDSVYSHVKRTYFHRKKPYRVIGQDALQKDPDIGEKKELVVLVVGETQRAMNYSLNGYFRPTNDYTVQQDVISFPHTVSCGTATATSVPCMFSNLTQQKYDKEVSLTQDNFLDIAKRSGVSVLWLDNDGGCKDVCQNVTTIDLRDKYKDDKEQCVGDGCHDSIFLSELPKQLDALPDTTSLIVLHIMGSHGPTYFNRYPKDHRVFAPDCARSDIQNCTHDQLMNAYDNTILYSDYVLSGIIDILKNYGGKRNSALIFMSDHGESLGEKGVYLHGLPYSVAPVEQTHIPFLVWMSQPFADDRGIDLACVREKLTTQNFSHDNLFHTMLGLLAIDANAYNKNLDVFTLCKTKTADVN